MKEEENGKNSFLKTDSGKSKLNAIEIPSISLPKGGGAIKGIDEKFSVNAVNGTSSFSIPLPFSPARGTSPSLNLSYNSGAGNGIFGLGWNISLASIKRKTDKGLPEYVDFVDSDTFLFSEVEDLVPEFKKETNGSFLIGVDGEYIINEKDSADGLFIIRYYRPRIEGLFARIERWCAKNRNEIKWKITTGDNTTTLFGWTKNARISNPEDSTKTFEWLAEFVFDDKGNCAHYIYKPEDSTGFDNSFLHNRNRIKDGNITYTNVYLSKILYGNKTTYKNFGNDYPPANEYLFSTVFDYGTLLPNDSFDTINNWDFRVDAFSDYKSGFEIRTTRLCKRVLLFHHFNGANEYDGLVRSVNFEYDTNAEEDFTFLKKIHSHGYIKKPDGSYSEKHLPPMEFTYQSHDWNDEVKIVQSAELVHAPAGLDEQQYQFIDLFNEGLNGILTEQANGWYYMHNLGEGKFEQAKLITSRPSFSGLGSEIQLADLDADGGKQLVSFSNELSGYFELDDENEWEKFRSFKAMPNIDFGDKNTRMLDLNGDGKPEVVISEDNVFTWYPSSGRNGFLQAQKTTKTFDEEAGPAVVFADQKQTIFMADMSGSGMADIVRIRNGEVCYWPNLGYGKFGSKVAMDKAPVYDLPDAFNPSYLRLTDIDGSGTTDIVYLGKNKFTCWKNLSGNRFGISPFEIDHFPQINAQAKITVADLLGNGVACIVWSSPLLKDANAPLKYIDLMNGKKPYIMVSYKNNMGKEVSLEYTPSTKFYLEDKKAGKPWITKLHFPIHCISKTITEDKISGYKFVSEYKYHHGYYDHAEREFRGFGMVEQIDAETFEHWKKVDATNITEEDLHQEPVVSKSWCHTGAYSRNEKILDQFSTEYWYEEMQRQGFAVTHHEVALPDARLITAPSLDPSLLEHLSIEERLEAYRACKGMALRSETFALDAIKFGNTEEARKKELTPFSVGTHNCIIELLQPKGNNKHAIFIVRESEVISYSYERNAADPRIAHNLNLKMDELGNVLEAAAVVYPRINPDLSLSLDIKKEQTKTIIAYTQNQYTNDVISQDDYRLRLPSEVKIFELKGIAKTGVFYSLNDFESILDTANELAYHLVNEEAVSIPQKRLIEHVRTNYRNNDLITILPLHKLQSLAMPFESFQLAFTPELLTDIYRAKVNDVHLEESKFIHSEGDNNWWIRSGTTEFIRTTETSSDAKNRFYAPISYTDPFGSTTIVKYYGDYFLFIQETEDALGHKSTAENIDPTKPGFNFRTLSSEWMKDINGNYSSAISDELGLVKAIAVLGKGNQADDLEDLHEFADQEETNLINEFFNLPPTIDGITNSTALHQKAQQLLQHATARFLYDFDAYSDRGKPVVVVAIKRETHYRTPNETLNLENKVQIAFEYSNGLGQVVMKKVQAEPGTAKKATINEVDNTVVIEDVLTNSQLRWVGNGRTILNNKGNAVKQYEPYFSVTNQYENFKELVETGVTPIMYYDAAGRLIKTEMPDGTFSKEEFDSWKQLSYDANDTVLESKWYNDRINNLIDDLLLEQGKDPTKEKLAAQKAALHFNTPAAIYLDTLGRSICTIAHNKRKDFILDRVIEEFYPTLAVLDTESNLRNVVDAAGNTVMQYKYNMLGDMLYQYSMDAGERWMLNDCMGKPFGAWDAKNQEFTTSYDSIHRPLESTLVKDDITIITSKQTYCNPNELSPAELLHRQKLNLVGQSLVQYDSAGKTELKKSDFKGNALETSRQLCRDYKTVPDWTNPASIEMETEIFSSSAELDALNRPIKSLTPFTDLIPPSVVMPSYNESGMLNVVDAQIRGASASTNFVTAIKHDAKGRRETMYYGNNSMTRYSYDNHNSRLIRLLTTTNSTILQDLRYTYDTVGNITDIQDFSQHTVFYNGQKVEAKNEYDYDATYQLIRATGREHIGQNLRNETKSNNNIRNFPFENSANANEINALRNYTQQYVYDAVGNILQMQHIANGASWTRKYWYNNNDADRNELSIDYTIVKNNQLLQTQIGSTTANRYIHDIQGNMLDLPQLQSMVWNYKDQLQQVGLGGGGNAFYVYDGSGQRLRKVIERNGGTKEERLYLGTIEIYRESNSAGVLIEATETLHITDDSSRIAMVDTKTIKNGSPAPSGDAGREIIRFIYSNHLSSSSLELNENATTISYEEYHPYGTTSFTATNDDIKAAAKRYRYTGMERDEETSMAYHSARYYLPWLGRWLSSDPIGIEGGINLYVYSKNNFLTKKDPNGTDCLDMDDEARVCHGDEEYQNVAPFIPEEEVPTFGPELPQGYYPLPPPIDVEKSKAKNSAAPVFGLDYDWENSIYNVLPWVSYSQDSVEDPIQDSNRLMVNEFDSEQNIANGGLVSFDEEKGAYKFLSYDLAVGKFGVADDNGDYSDYRMGIKGDFNTVFLRIGSETGSNISVNSGRATVDISAGTDGISVAAGASIISLDTNFNSSETGTRLHVGLSAGPSAGFRLHFGHIGIGAGADIGPVSVDIKQEIPKMSEKTLTQKMVFGISGHHMPW